MHWELANAPLRTPGCLTRRLMHRRQIFVPAVQYPDGYRVELSAGAYREEPERCALVIAVADEREARDAASTTG